jgi:predicted transcriptional regulator
MTDAPDDGWPEPYRDPRDRPHPDVLRVTVESFDGGRTDTVEAAEAAEEGKEPPAVVSVASVADLREILTDRRLELLETLVAIDGAAESIAALATALDRDYRTVHDDVSLLADHGLLFIVEDGRAKRPYIPYERIRLDVELVGGRSDEEPAPA